ncbi:MAG: CDP-glucose 4,6-dehydratase [Desulfobacterales bacterium]|nr:CDP-glucose 4,6-dehydratase [Desulfobacterales bacterium]
MNTFFQGKKVFITGHTGFKGSWLSLWLHKLGAQVTGYALDPPTNPSLFKLCRIDELINSVIADIRDLEHLKESLQHARPEIVIHMAAQPLVRDSYAMPVDTFAVNVMGTVNLLEAVRSCDSVKSVVVVTTDKVYENREWLRPYREDEPLGGYDPYSSSKACAELVTAAYRSSFFSRLPTPGFPLQTSIATARAGNVIGGGDWGKDRLIPDCIRALLSGDMVRIRNPHAIRPWQHVLEPLSGYLLLARRLYEEGFLYAEAWNFGPDDIDERPVEWVVRRLCEKWGVPGLYQIDGGVHHHEAGYLKLDSSKARSKLGWTPVWSLEAAIDETVEWTKAYNNGKNVRNICLNQITQYEDFKRAANTITK